MDKFDIILQQSADALTQNLDGLLKDFQDQLPVLPNTGSPVEDVKEYYDNLDAVNPVQVKRDLAAAKKQQKANITKNKGLSKQQKSEYKGIVDNAIEELKTNLSTRGEDKTVQGLEQTKAQVEKRLQYIKEFREEVGKILSLEDQVTQAEKVAVLSQQIEGKNEETLRLIEEVQLAVKNASTTRSFIIPKIPELKTPAKKLISSVVKHAKTPRSISLSTLLTPPDPEKAFKKFTSTLTDSQKKSFTSAGTKKQLDESTGGNYNIYTSAAGQIWRLYDYAAKNNLNITFTQKGNQYEFYITPLKYYDPKDIEKTRKNSYKVRWVAPDEYGRTREGDWGSIQGFAYDINKNAFTDQNTLGLKMQVDSIINNENGKKGKMPPRFKVKDMEDSNSQLSKIRQDNNKPGPVDHRGVKSEESYEKDQQRAPIGSKITERELKALQSRMNWASTLNGVVHDYSKYVRGDKGLQSIGEARRDFLEELLSVSFEEGIPQEVQDLFSRLLHAMGNTPNYKEAPERMNDPKLRALIDSPLFSPVLDNLENYFSQGLGYFVENKSHASSATGKAASVLQYSIEMPDMLAMGMRGAESMSKGKFSSRYSKIADYDALINKGWEESSLRYHEGDQSVQDLIVSNFLLPVELLQEIANRDHKGIDVVPVITEEILMGNSSFANSIQFYGNTVKQGFSGKDERNKVNNFLTQIFGQIGEINNLAIGEAISLNQDLNVATQHELKLNEKVKVPKGSYITGVTHNLDGTFTIDYVPTEVFTQGKKLIALGTNQRHEGMHYNQQTAMEVISQYAQEGKIPQGLANIIIGKLQNHEDVTFSARPEDKRFESARTQGNFNEPFYEWLVNRIATKEQYEAIAQDVGGFAGRYSWDSKVKGVVSRLSQDQGIIISSGQGAYYENNSLWTEIDPYLRGELEHYENVKQLRSEGKNEEAEKMIASLLPQARQMYGSQVKSEVITSMYEDIGEKLHEMGAISDDEYASLGYIRGLALSGSPVYEYADKTGLTEEVGVRESQMRIAERLKTELYLRPLEAMVASEQITQEEADRVLQGFSEVYKGDQRDIDKYNDTYSAYVNIPIPEKERVKLVFANGNVERFGSNAIDISQLDFTKPLSSGMTKQEYEKSAIGQLYKKVYELKGKRLGEEVQAEFDVTDMDSDQLALLKKLGYVSKTNNGRVVLPFTPEEVVKETGAFLGINDSVIYDFLQGASLALRHDKLTPEERTRLEKIRKKTNDHAAGYMQSTLKEKLKPGEDLYKYAMGKKAIVSGNFKVMQGTNPEWTDEDELYAYISPEGGKKLLDIGTDASPESIRDTYTALVKYLEEKAEEFKEKGVDTPQEIKELLDKDWQKSITSKSKEKREKAYIAFRNKFLETVYKYQGTNSNNPNSLNMFIPSMGTRDPILQGSNVFEGVKLNSPNSDSKQDPNVLYLPALLMEKLNADFDGDMVRITTDLNLNKGKVGRQLVEYMIKSGIRTKKQMVDAGLEGAVNAETPEEMEDRIITALLKEATLTTDPYRGTQAVIATHQGQRQLGLASYQNTQTQLNLEYMRAARGATNEQLLRDYISHALFSQIVEQKGISAKKWSEDIVAGEFNLDHLSNLISAFTDYDNISDDQRESVLTFIQKGMSDNVHIIEAISKGLSFYKISEDDAKMSGLLDDKGNLTREAVIGMLKANAEANTFVKNAEGQDKFNIEQYKEKRHGRLNPYMAGSDSRPFKADYYPGRAEGELPNLFEERGEVGALNKEYSEHSEKVQEAADAEKAKLIVSGELAKKLSAEADAIKNLTGEFEDLTQAEEESAKASEKLENQAESTNSVLNKDQPIITGNGSYIPVIGGPGKSDNFDKDHNYVFSGYTRNSKGELEQTDFATHGKNQIVSVSTMAGTTVGPEHSLYPGSPEATAMYEAALKGTYAHRMVELQGLYQKNSVEELKQLALTDSELAKEIAKAEKPIRDRFNYNPEETLKDLNEKAGYAIGIARKVGMIGSPDTTVFEKTLAGSFADSGIGIAGQADIINYATGMVGDWKFSNDISKETIGKRILQVATYRAMEIMEDEAKLTKLDSLISNEQDPQKLADLQQQKVDLTSQLSALRSETYGNILTTTRDKNDALIGIHQQVELPDIEKLFGGLENLAIYNSYLQRIREKTELAQTRFGEEKEKVLNEIRQLEQESDNFLKTRGISIPEIEQSITTRNETIYDESGEEIKGLTVEEVKKGAQEKNKERAIKDYISTLKKMYAAEEEIEKTKKSNLDPSSAQNIIQSLQQQRNILAQSLPVYDKQQGTINGVKLSQEQLNKLEQDYILMLSRHDVNMKKIQLTSSKTLSTSSRFLQQFSNRWNNFLNFGLANKFLNFITSSLRRIITLTQELDKQIVNISIASGDSRNVVTSMFGDFAEIGKKLGRTTTDVSNAANDWLRAGYRGKEVYELIEGSMSLSTLGMIQSGEATKYLISTLKGWKLEVQDVVEVVDKLTAVDMSAAISAGDLALAMSRANNSARMAGVNLDRYIGYITTIADVSQKSPQSIGESFKTIFSRFGNVKTGKFLATDLEKSSSDYDESDFENLNDIEATLSKVNIKLRETPTTWRNIDDVLSDIGSRWDNWDQTTKNAIATAIAGTRQRENVITLFENWDSVEKFTNISKEAYGTSAEKMLSYTDSIEAAKNRLTVAFEELTLSFKGSGVIKTFYEELAFVVENLRTFTAALGILTVVTQREAIEKGLATFGAKLGSNLTNLGKFSLFSKNSGGFLQSLFAVTKSLISGKNNINMGAIFPGGLGSGATTNPIYVNKYNNLARLIGQKGDATQVTPLSATQLARDINNYTSQNGILIRSGALKIAGIGLGGLTGRKAIEALGGSTTAQGIGAVIGSIAGSSLGRLPYIKESVKTGGIKELLSGTNLIPGLGMAVTALTSIVSIVKLIHDNQIKAAQERFKEKKESYDKVKGMVPTAKRWDELQGGVDAYGRNVSLSTEEYQEFLKVSNELGEAAPDMISYINQEGNAILKLGDNYSSATKQIESYIKTKQQEADEAYLDPKNLESVMKDYKAYYNKAITPIAFSENSVLSVDEQQKIFDAYRRLAAGIVSSEDYNIVKTAIDSQGLLTDKKNNQTTDSFLQELISGASSNKLALEPIINAVLRQDTTWQNATSDYQELMQQAISFIDLSGFTNKNIEAGIQNIVNTLLPLLQSSGLGELGDYSGKTVAQYEEGIKAITPDKGTVLTPEMKQALVGLGFVEGEDGRFTYQTLNSKIQGLVGEEKLSSDFINNLDWEDAIKLYKWYNSGALKGSSGEFITDENTITNLLRADREGSNTLYGKQAGVSKKVANIEEWGVATTDLTIDAIQNFSIDKVFQNYSENVRDQLKELQQDVEDGVVNTQFDYQERMKEIWETILVEAENAQGQLLDILLDESFSKDLGIEGYIDTFSELKKALEAVGETFKALSDAQKEYRKNGQLSLKTTLDLVTSNENYLKVLDFENGKIKLASNAKEIMAKVQLETVKASMLLTAQQKREALAVIESQIKEVETIIKTNEGTVEAYDSYIGASETRVNAMERELKVTQMTAANMAGLSAVIKAFYEGTDPSRIGDLFQQSYNEVYGLVKDIPDELKETEELKVLSTDDLKKKREQLIKEYEEGKKDLGAWETMITKVDDVLESGNFEQWLNDEKLTDTLENASKALERLKSAIGALNLEYEQMIAYNEKGLKGIDDTAKALDEQYYTVKEKLIDKAIAEAQKKLGNKTLDDILKLSGDEFDEALAYYKDLMDLTVQKRNLDDEELNNQIEMIKVLGQITDEQIDLLRKKRESVDTEIEYLQTTKELNDAMRERVELAKELAEYQKKLLDYQLEYLKATPDSNTYQKTYEGGETALTEARDRAKELYDKTLQDQMELLEREFPEKSPEEILTLAKESSEYRNAQTEYIEAQKALSDYYMVDFNNKVDAAERRIKLLKNQKPEQWSNTVLDGTDSVLEGIVDEIKIFYSNLNKEHQTIVNEASRMLLESADKLTDEQIITLVDKYNDSLKQIKANNIAMLNDIKTHQENVYNAMTAEIEEYKQQLEKEKELIGEYYDKELEKLNDKNEAIERTNRLLELQKNLLNAQQERERVYRAGIGWVYETNREKVKQAERDLQDFYRQDSVEDLQKAKDKELEILDDRIKNWDDYLNMLQTQYNEYERLERKKLLVQEFGLENSQKLEELIMSDMNEFTDYMSNHTKDFFDNQIDAQQDFNSKFGDFLGEYKTNLEELARLNRETIEGLNYNDYLGKNDNYLDIPDISGESNKSTTNKSTTNKTTTNKDTEKPQEVVKNVVDAVEKAAEITQTVLDKNKKNETEKPTSSSINFSKPVSGNKGSLTSTGGGGSGLIKKTMMAYDTGIENGPVTFTGLAMLHGTPTAPEYVLNSDQAYNLLRNMTLKKPEFTSNLDKANCGDSWILNGDIVLENCDNPAEFWNEVTKAMSNRFNVTKQKFK